MTDKEQVRRKKREGNEKIENGNKKISPDFTNSRKMSVI